MTHNSNCLRKKTLPKKGALSNVKNNKFKLKLKLKEIQKIKIALALELDFKQKMVNEQIIHKQIIHILENRYNQIAFNLL